MKTIPYRVALLLFLIAGSTGRAEPIAVTWENADVSQPNQPFQDPEFRTVILNTGPMGIQLVDSSSNPTSPFANGAPGLLVESSEDAPFWFRLQFRPFDEVARDGVIEFEVQPLVGNLVIQVGNHPAPWVPDLIETYAITNSAFSIAFKPGDTPKIAGIAVATDSISHIEAETTYRVTLKWSFSGADPIFRVFLNGEVVRRQGSMDPLNPPIPAAVSTGINAFRITLGSSENNLGKASIGPMEAADGVVSDVEQADDPLLQR